MNESKKIILIVSQYFTPRDEFRYGIGVFKEKGYDVNVWDLSKIVQSGSIDHIVKNSGDFHREYLSRFDLTDTVVKKIAESPIKLNFITMIGYDRDTRKIFKAISTNGYDYTSTGPYSIGVFPNFANERKVNYSGRLWFFNISYLTNLFKRIINLDLKLPARLFRIKPAKTFVLAGGTKSTAIGPIIGSSTKIIKIHAADYDSYLIKMQKNSLHDAKKYIVYIDQAIAAATDAYARGRQLEIDADKYYSDLSDFFTKIEGHYKMPVVVAAHPKANYEKLGYSFGDHEIRSGFNSAELISDASLVLLHYSTAINLAITFKKPIIFLTSEVLEKYKKPFIDGLSAYFGMKPININDREVEFPTIEIDQKKYKKYFEEFIKAPGTSELPFWETVISVLEDILD
jgi:hypothetical protein